MNLESLKFLIDQAVEYGCGQLIDEACGDYYFPYYQLFLLLAQEYSRPHLESEADIPVAVELGVDKGNGVYALWLGGCLTFGIEHNDKECFTRDLLKHEKLVLYRRSSTPYPETMPANRCISILHLDTEHTYAQVKAEWEAWEPYLLDGAVVCFDDMNAAEGEVARFFDELPYEKIREDRLHPTCGYGVLIYRAPV